MENKNQGILLDAGTNELEIVTFSIGKSIFSINVMKVREIIRPVQVTSVPESHDAIEGVVQVRGEIIPVINLARMLKLEDERNEDGNAKKPEDTKFIISELNQLKVVFRVDEVYRIQRISWTQIEEPTTLSMGLEETTSGIVKLDEKIILMLDYEKIVNIINPMSENYLKEAKQIPKIEQRKEKTILIAEDSAMLRQIIEDGLKEAGYEKLVFFKNGQDAYDYVNTLTSAKGDELSSFVDLIVTDIEMPKLDGHTLTKNLKENKYTSSVPVVIYSSLVAPELEHKGESVGANSQVSKPEITKLITIMDKLLF